MDDMTSLEDDLDHAMEGLRKWKARAEKAEAKLVDAEERAEIAEAKLSRVRTHLRNGGPTDAVALYFLFDGVT